MYSRLIFKSQEFQAVYCCDRYQPSSVVIIVICRDNQQIFYKYNLSILTNTFKVRKKKRKPHKRKVIAKEFRLWGPLNRYLYIWRSSNLRTMWKLMGFVRSVRRVHCVYTLFTVYVLMFWEFHANEWVSFSLFVHWNTSGQLKEWDILMAHGILNAISQWC